MDMKRILTLLAIAIVGLVSCKKMEINRMYSEGYDLYSEFQKNLYYDVPYPPFGAEKDLYGEYGIKWTFDGVNLTIDAFEDTWSVSCDADWCHYGYTTDVKEQGTKGTSIACCLKLSVTVDENTTGETRDANINITCYDNTFQLTITQLGIPEVIVTTPGTLTQELAKKDLLYSTSIKISGELNDKDLKIIKELREIEILDLTGAIIDDLPDEMFYKNKTIKQVKLPETIKVIHPRTFAYSSLEYIYFPASIETIEDGDNPQNWWSTTGAFVNTNLTTIGFAPDSRLKYIGDCAFAGAGKKLSDGYCEELEIIFPASVETIGDEVFMSNPTGLTDVSVSFEEQSLLKTVGDISAFTLDFNARNCQMLQSFGYISSGEYSNQNSYITMTLGTNVPPICSGVSSSTARYLYVPKGCVGAYYEADGWKEFYTIKEIE